MAVEKEDGTSHVERYGFRFDEETEMWILNNLEAIEAAAEEASEESSEAAADSPVQGQSMEQMQNTLARMQQSLADLQKQIEEMQKALAGRQ